MPRRTQNKRKVDEEVTATYKFDGVARDMYLVYRLYKEGGVYAHVLLRPSKYQYYDFRDSHSNFHLRIHKIQLPRYCSQVESEGFVRIEDPAETDVRPEKYYFIIESDVRECHVKEVSVVNNLHEMNEYKHVIEYLPFEWMVKKMLVTEYISGLDSTRGRKRSNIRWDIGYTGVDSKNRSITPGMNMPNLITACRQLDGHGDDPSREHTMFKMGCIAFHVHEMVCNNHPDSDISCGFSKDKERRRLFCDPWFESLELHESWSKYARFEGSSAFVCGDTVDFRMKKTEMHVDQDNAREEGHNHSPTITALVPVVLKDGGLTEVMAGVNIYQKKPVSDGMFRLRTARSIGKQLQCHLAKPGSGLDTGIPLHARFQHPEDNDDSDAMTYTLHDDVWAYPAHSQKDGFYSMYANEVVDFGGECQRNEALMVEMLYSIIFTPCPLAWRKGFRRAAAKFRRQRNPRGKESFLILFFGAMRELCPTNTNEGGSVRRVSWGVFPRVRVHVRKTTTYRSIFKSLKNLLQIMRLAKTTSDSRMIVSLMNSSPKDGGVLFVGQFWGQTLLQVAARAQVVDGAHMENALLAETTTTFKRLCKWYGNLTTTFAADLVPWLSRELGLPEPICEQGLCELGRFIGDTNNKMDVFAPGHLLYERKEGQSVKTDANGRSSCVRLGDCEMNEFYDAFFKWWDHDFRVADAAADASWDLGDLVLND